MDHDCWMMLVLLRGQVQGQNQFRSWSGSAPASWLLQPGHPANEDFDGDSDVLIASVLFDALALPGWTNPLTRLELPAVVPCRDPERQQHHLDALMEPCQQWSIVDPVAAMRARPKLEQLLLDHLLDGIEIDVYGALVDRSGNSEFELALDTIAKRLDDADLDVPAMARLVGFSPSGFSKACRRRLGYGPRTWLRRERIRLAARLLQSLPDQPVRDIAWRCGYRSVPLFNRHFLQITGMRPRDLRRRDR